MGLWAGKSAGFVVSGNDGALVPSSSRASVIFFDHHPRHLGVITAPIIYGASITVMPAATGFTASRDLLQVYTVESGDTLFGIAKKFGLKAETIFGSNPSLSSASLLRVGMKLLIPPGDGVVHEVRRGETLASVAKRYAVPEAAILVAAGPISEEGPQAGALLFVAGAKPRRSITPSPSLALPALPGYFITPTNGRNWGRLHGHNGVDIASPCGTPVIAAAGGVVIRAQNSGWNQGAGQYVMIQHPNGTQTLYGHLQELAVTLGAVLEQGAVIGAVGNTGLTRGVTGCHLHFEVRGARNPLVRR